ncbi:MAG: zinc ribbon domain-containing protein [Candidatus Nanoarchaeia archaeon]
MEENNINKKIICQSCAMPMKKEDDFGTNEDGSYSKEYCCFCFEGGDFKDKGITLQEKIDKLTQMGQKLGLTEEQARKMAEIKLPGLKRWKK